jgi:hypothetical protein
MPQLRGPILVVDDDPTLRDAVVLALQGVPRVAGRRGLISWAAVPV